MRDKNGDSTSSNVYPLALPSPKNLCAFVLSITLTIKVSVVALCECERWLTPSIDPETSKSPFISVLPLIVVIPVTFNPLSVTLNLSLLNTLSTKLFPSLTWDIAAPITPLLSRKSIPDSSNAPVFSTVILG